MAEIHHMSSLPPDMDNDGAPADGQGAGGGQPKRDKRKKKVDGLEGPNKGGVAMLILPAS